jgi:hypothetical protein
MPDYSLIPNTYPSSVSKRNPAASWKTKGAVNEVMRI